VSTSKQPTCVFCGTGIRAGVTHTEAPIFFPRGRVWACRACYDQRKGEEKKEAIA
jgi:hypothetical protein